MSGFHAFLLRAKPTQEALGEIKAKANTPDTVAQPVPKHISRIQKWNVFLKVHYVHQQLFMIRQ
jgi:hypothetical protein